MRRVLVLAITLATVGAAAHVAPSVDDNNRYLKLTPLGDRVRLAYTVFFGEVPGAQARRSIDSDRNGSISDAEGAVFGNRVAAEVAAALEITVDQQRHPVAWHLVSVGMGTPQTTGGSFSIDMVTYLCFRSARGRHEVRLRDRFRIPKPGETEIRIEDSPGITIDRARLGDIADPTHEFKLVGPSGPLADPGLEVVMTASDQAAVASDAICSAAPATRGLPTLAVIGAAAVLGAMLAAATMVVLRRRRRARSSRA
ncbi:MAG: hypothetical protein H0T89_20060 [Deltaproteobacteria bacterium]|nr:hypothetical protein [Deltaproteobacteria bacterium]MDQ3296371.1 hypothetical protein [Myxococcota bacterium]